MQQALVEHPGPASAAANAATWVPKFPAGLLRNLAIDVGLPWLAVQVLTRGWGWSSLSAIAVVSLFPAASVVVNWWRRRRVDYLGLAILVTLLGGLALALAAGDIRFALLKAVPGAVIFGLACLATLGRRAPLMFFIARQFTAGDDPEKLAAWTGRLDRAGFRRAMRLLTLVWGLAFLAKAGLWIAIALLLPPGAAVLAAPVLGLATFAALMAWTIAFARRRAAAAAGNI